MACLLGCFGRKPGGHNEEVLSPSSAPSTGQDVGPNKAARKGLACKPGAVDGPHTSFAESEPTDQPAPGDAIKVHHGTLTRAVSRQLVLDSPAAFHEGELGHILAQAQQQLRTAQDACSQVPTPAAAGDAAAQELPALQQLESAVATGSWATDELAQHLHCLRHWLANSASIGAADMLLRTASAALQDTEALLLQAAPSTWTASTVHTGLALLQLYADLTKQALNPRPSAKPLRAALAQVLLARPQPVLLMSRMLEVALQARSGSTSSQQAAAGGAGQAVPHLDVMLWELLHMYLRFAGVTLTPRKVLPAQQQQQRQQLPFNSFSDTSSSQQQRDTGCSSITSSDYTLTSAGSVAVAAAAAAAAAVAARHEVMCGAAVIDLSAWCQQVVALLQQQPLGVLRQALQQPFTLPHAAGQLAAMQALKQLYTLQQSQIIGQDVGGVLVAIHYHAFLQHYHAAGPDPLSAAAHLAGLHLQLLRAAVASGSVLARLHLQQVGAVDMLLGEFSLESRLYSEEQARAAEEDAAATDSDMVDDDDFNALGSPVSPGQERVRHSHSRASPGAVRHSHKGGARASPSGKAPAKFVFTYDLNEDVERLMALEEQTGHAVELDGLEYDEQAKQLMARAPLMPSPPPGPGLSNGTTPRAPPHLPPLRLNASPSRALTARSLRDAPSHLASPSGLLGGAAELIGGATPTTAATPGGPEDMPTSPGMPEASRPSAVPRLALGSLRSAASSRIMTPLRASRADGLGSLSSRSRHKDALAMSMRSHHGHLGHVLSGGMAASGQLMSSRSERPPEGPLSPLGPGHAHSTRATMAASAPPDIAVAHAAAAAAAATPLASSRLHHSHLSPLSSRRSLPSPTTRVTSIITATPQPSARSVAPPSGLGTTQEEDFTGADDAAKGSSSGVRTGGGVLPAGHAGQAQLQPGPHSEAAHAAQHHSVGDYHREATCSLLGEVAAQGQAQAHPTLSDMPAISDLPAPAEVVPAVSSEVWDTVPDLQPRPPSLPHPGLALMLAMQGQGQAGRGLGPSGASKPVPALNLGNLNNNRTTPQLGASEGGAARGTDSSRRSTLPTRSTVCDSAMNPHHLAPSTGCTSPVAVTPFRDQAAGLLDDVAVGSPAGQGCYLQAVQAKLWFHSPELHAQLLHLLCCLLLTPSGTLDPAYAQPFPADNGVINVEHLLMWHLAAPAGSVVLPHLLQLLAAPRTAELQHGSSSVVYAACLRLVRLLSRQLFAPERYVDLTFHSRGAYGAVYRAKVQGAGAGGVQHVMVKAIELPGTGFDRCVLPDVFGEVSILERYALQPSMPALVAEQLEPSILSETVPDSQRSTAPGASAACGSISTSTSRAAACQGICQLQDYGLTQGAYWLVMRRYRCSLAEWRARQLGPPSPTALAMYLSVLQQVIDSMQLLAADAVVHFDLKASNVLVEPLEGVKDTQLYGPPPPPPCLPPFRPVLADFGEARAYRNSDEAYTARNRGTEVYKSPEMLLMHAAFPPNSQGGVATPSLATGAGGLLPTPPPMAPAPAAGGAGLASDVWSFGLLAYELLSGRMLFSEADYASVTHRVAFGGGARLSLTASEVAALGPQGGPLQELVEGILVRDPAHRPCLRSIHARLANARAAMLELATAAPAAPPA